MAEETHHSRLTSLALGALGVVFGDIGTSPLYAVRECFHGMHAVALTQDNVLGVLSLIFWSLLMVVGVKYVSFILRADNHGEGGIFALLALLPQRGSPGDDLGAKARTAIILAAVFGSALLYGDGVITPAVSVLSAVEGLSVATTALEPAVLPVTCVILVGLFLMQKHGTGRIGALFGPIMIFWFLALAALGLAHIWDAPHILLAVNPLHALCFFRDNGLHGMVVLGSVVLCITGGEALYADMGHFGRRAIRLSWNGLVLPALLLNYFGQGALLLADPAAAQNPFFQMVPDLLLYPLVALATVATIIASQAMISGAFSLTQQAIQLGYCPRMHIVHTSGQERGQIYIPLVNQALMLGCLGLVLFFRESSRLAGAYGIAVTATMTITSIAYFLVITRTWRWSPLKAGLLLALFLVFDASYLGANLLKLADGGWITIAIALAISVLMSTWKRGRAELAAQSLATRLPIEIFIGDVSTFKPHRVPGTAVFMTLNDQGTPVTLLHHFKHNKVLHEAVLLLTVRSAQSPTVPESQRVQVAALDHGFYRVVAQYGFMETPHVPDVLRLAEAQGVRADPASTTFFLGRETILPSGRARMAEWRKRLFSFMSRNAGRPTTFFGIPPSRTVELGAMIEL
jgi:KUP system potassium uptake protein